MLKKLAAVLVCIVMMACVTVGFAEDADVVEPTLLKLFGKSKFSWYATAENRALFAATVSLEVMSDEKPEYGEIIVEALTTEEIYVADTGDDLIVVFWGKEQYILALYSPDLEVILVSAAPSPSASSLRIMNELKNSGNVDSYYNIGFEEYMDALDRLDTLVSGLLD